LWHFCHLLLVIRQQPHWDAGTRLVVEITPDGVLLRAAPLFSVTKPRRSLGRFASAERPTVLRQWWREQPARPGRSHARG